MWQLVKTYWGYPRMRDDRWVARVEVNHMYRCKGCGLYFWDKEKMKRHKHEEEKQVPT
jgi:hypothetical protein